MSQQPTSGWLVPLSFAFRAYGMLLRALELGIVLELASEPYTVVPGFLRRLG